MSKDNLKRYALLVLGGGMGGFLTLGAATLPAFPVFAGAGGALLLSLAAWSAWIGVMLLFINLNIILGFFDKPPEWEWLFFIFFFALLILLFCVKLWGKESFKDPVTLPLLCWSVLVIFSVVPAMRNEIWIGDWYSEAMPLLLPALFFVIPRSFTDHASLKKFLVVLLLVCTPVLWDFTGEYLQYQRLYGRGAGVQEFRLGMLQPLRDVSDPGARGEYFFWQAEGLGLWLFLGLFSLFIYAASLLKKVVYALLASFQFLLIFLWMRRTGLASVLFGTFLFLVLAYRRRGWGVVKQAAVLWLVIALFCAVVLWDFGVSGYINTNRLVTGYSRAFLGGTSDPSFQWRAGEFPHAIRAFLQSPLIGHGLAYEIPGLASIYPRAEQAEAGSFLHDFGLSLLVKTGLLGFAAFVWFMVVTWRRLLKSSRITTDPFYQSLLLAGIGALAALLLRAPLDDILSSSPTQFPLAILLAIASRVTMDSGAAYGATEASS